MAMGTISNAFTTISGALQADQAALSVVANNVANANTVGYTLETANFQENDPVTIGTTTYGQGTQETGATSVRDRVLTERLDQQQQLASASTTRLTALNTVQALFTPDSGSSTSKAGDIGSDLTSFFDSFSSLEGDPTSNSLRQNVLTTATTLAGDISNAAASLNAQRASLDQDASGMTSQVNALTSSIAQLNLQIESTSPNSDAGVLEDQRQQDISKLSNLVGINQITTENNGLSITTTSGAELVSEGITYPMTSGLVNGMTHFFIGTSDITSGLASGGGQLGGYLTVRDQDIPNVLSSLDQLAYSVSTSVNALNNSGNDMAGVGGTVAAPLNIFNEPAAGVVAGSAANMSVVMTNPDQISAAAAGAGTGDNSNAIALASLASKTIIPSGGSSQTPTDFYSSFVSTLGATITEVQTENTAQNASVTQLKTQNDALSGVNLDDEASEMTTLERSYQAATQVFTMLDTLIQSTINLGQATAAG
jgi:flagellar hook-associated protein 1 FlgK